MASSSENASPKKFQSKRSMRRGGAAGADGSSSSDGGNGDGASLVPIVNIADMVAGQQKYVFFSCFLCGYLFYILC